MLKQQAQKFTAFFSCLSLLLSVILPPSCSGIWMDIEKERTLKVSAAPGEH